LSRVTAARRRPGREARGLDARLGDVHPVARQPVQLPQPAARPRARRDDRGGRLEDLALARAHRGAVAVRRPVAERHVHEHDESQPARLRHEDLGSGGRDQAVDQHHGAVRDPLDGAREGGVPRHGEVRERVGDRVLAHRPAEIAEAPADPAVVRIAAARLRRVVDALRDDGVDLGHSDRS
jgi:hypothetical protein